MSEQETIRIEGAGPMPVHAARETAELCDLVKRAVAERQALFPVGGGTHLSLGHAPDRDGWAVRLGGLCQVIDYPARDMTVTVQAGITLARLQAVLEAEGQRLPIDVPDPERATVGGALAVNASGPRRLGSGTLRDYLIGISFVNDQGEEVKAGGRVVKNVAGYDLCKLQIGALGTLGIITQATFKLRPRPEARALITLGCQGSQLGPLMDRLHQTRTRPACIDVLNQGAVRKVADRTGLCLPDAPWVVIFGYEDNDESVSWQTRQVLTELSSAHLHGVEARAGQASDPLWTALCGLTALPAAGLSLKANMLPAAVASFCQQLASLPEGALVQAHAGSGIVRAHWEESPSLARARDILSDLQLRAEQARGSLILPRCPLEWKKELPIWGQPRGDLGLMRRVKETLDPRRLFNPGRFLHGI